MDEVQNNGFLSMVRSIAATLIVTMEPKMSLRTLPSLIAAVALACGTADVDVPLGSDMDSDEDGLSDADEIGHGTDPDNPDSDNDGFSDGDEIAQGADPLSGDDHPYTGGYGADSCRDEIASTGHAEGDIAEDFELMDQFGETVRLHDFCGRAVLLVSGAFW